MEHQKGHIGIWTLLAAGLLASLSVSCSNSDDAPAPNAEEQEIRFNADVWKVMEGTRVTTYDNATALQTEGSFTAAAYVAESTTPYINSTQVNYSTSTTPKWTFSDGKHYWPASDALDFFAYLPTTPPNYITDMNDVPSQVTYENRNPQFKCINLFTNNGGQDNIKEFIYALATGQNKAEQGASGVTLTFQHPFALIYLQLSTAQAVPITIKTITFKTIKKNGTYTHNGSPNKWAPTGDATNFVVTLNQDYTVTHATQELGGPYLMIPQEWTGGIDVEATWNNWGVPTTETLSTTVPTTWLPGYSYTYTFTINKFSLIVDVAKFTEQW